MEEYGPWPWKRWLNPFLIWIELPIWWIEDRVYWVTRYLWNWAYSMLYSLVEHWVSAPLLLKFIYMVNLSWIAVMLIALLILGLEATFMLSAVYD